MELVNPKWSYWIQNVANGSIVEAGQHQKGIVESSIVEMSIISTSSLPPAASAAVVFLHLFGCLFYVCVSGFAVYVFKVSHVIGCINLEIK